MDNSIINNAKTQTPAARQQPGERTAPQEGTTHHTATGSAARPEAKQDMPVSGVIQDREAAQTALERLKELIAQQPSAALAAYSRITGQATSGLLDSAVSNVS